LVASLAVADLFVACLVMPLGAVYEVSCPPLSFYTARKTGGLHLEMPREGKGKKRKGTFLI